MAKGKRHNALKVILLVVVVVLLLIAAALMYYVKFYKEDLNKNVPMTLTVQPKDKKPEDITYRFWYKIMQDYKETKNPWEKLSDPGFNTFQLLAGDENEFAVGATFQVKLDKGKWSTHHNWGKVQKDGTIKNIQWTFRIKKIGTNKYTLEHIESTTKAIGDLPPVKDEYQKKAGIKVTNNSYRAEIMNGKLRVTYDYGNGNTHWREVPISVEDLFQGDYSGTKNSLIEGSYVVSPEKTAFVLGSGNDLRILMSIDEGGNWNQYPIQSPIQGIRLRILGFTSEDNGYLILTGDRTMSVEGHVALKTHDGGKTWSKVGGPPVDYLATSGGFINDQLGFMSFGSRGTPAHPIFYRTTDGGAHWKEVQIPIPTEYKGIFTVAEVPSFDGPQGTLLVNQGPNGDYEGGNVLARFFSIDNGATWSFKDLVDPDNVIQTKP